MKREPESEDAALAEAYAHEDARADAAQRTFGMAWVFAIVPAALLLLLLSGLLGDWVWVAWLPLFVAWGYGGPLLSRLAVRWRSDLPLDLPDHGRMEGPRKKRLVLAAAAMLVGVVLWAFLYEPMTIMRLREALLDWRI